jgi:nitrite reductase/ring-hydroxylating ferredoxin subunit
LITPSANSSRTISGRWAESDLAEGTMRRVDVDGSRILLAKRDGQVYAIAEVCSHLGGPLAEGKFEDCTVQCPWHGSRFSIEDGSVVHGPAVHKEPSLEVRVANGQIEVRAKQE